MFAKDIQNRNSRSVDELKIALDNRAFEIQMFWQRSNYFLVLMTALGIGTFSVRDVLFSPLVALFATGCSFLWFKTNLGSKFWQESWEAEVSLLAKESKVRSFEKPTNEVIAQVEVALKGAHSEYKRSIFRRWIDGEVLKKPSVTYHMIILSLLASIIWAIVTIIFLWRLQEHLCVTRHWCLNCGMG